MMYQTVFLIGPDEGMTWLKGLLGVIGIVLFWALFVVGSEWLLTRKFPKKTIKTFGVRSWSFPIALIVVFLLRPLVRSIDHIKLWHEISLGDLVVCALVIGTVVGVVRFIIRKAKEEREERRKEELNS